MLKQLVSTPLAMAMLAAAVQAEDSEKMPENGYVTIAGAEIYYEIHGEGAPLVMLHGGVNPSDFLGAPLAEMARNFRVIAVHARGHGLSKDTEAPWSLEQNADDVAGVLDHLGIEKASVMGYSFGGAVALNFAMRHQAKVEKLVVISASYSKDGKYPEVRALFDQMPAMAEAIGGSIAQSPLAEIYPEVDWVEVMRKTGTLNARDYDWSEGIKAITAPTLLIFADADAIPPEHMAEFYKLLGGGQRDAGMDGSQRSVNQLAIIPNTTHYNVIKSPALFTFANDFLGN